MVSACRGPAIKLCLPTLVLIAQAVLLLQREQTDKHTNRQMQLNALPLAGSYTPSVGKYRSFLGLNG